MRIVVTGAAGFIGRHVKAALERREGYLVEGFDIDSPIDEMLEAATHADVIVHLAGVNRPSDEREFITGNVELTDAICAAATRGGKEPILVLASSIHADGDSAYGRSKRLAEARLEEWTTEISGSAAALRLSNVFGKWCRPNYNSFVATLCHAIATDAPYNVSDPLAIVALVHVDDVVRQIVDIISTPPSAGSFVRAEVGPIQRITLGDLEELIRSFRESRVNLKLPDFGGRFTQSLYSTYLSYLPRTAFQYELETRRDERGSLAEFIKGPSFGQVFVSRTMPGVTRGNHWHETKAEKFLVVDGDAAIRFRQIGGTDVIEFVVTGQDFRVLDIPPGYAHSIQNVGSSEMVCVFWASEIFDLAKPDTFGEAVLRA